MPPGGDDDEIEMCGGGCVILVVAVECFIFFFKDFASTCLDRCGPVVPCGLGMGFLFLGSV